MDRRREQRIPTDQPAIVTVFGPPDVRVTARILDLSGRGLRVQADRPLPPGAAVKVEAEDVLFLGEVCYSIPANPGFEAGLTLEHSLMGLKELARLNQRLVDGWQAPAEETSLEDKIAAGSA